MGKDPLDIRSRYEELICGTWVPHDEEGDELFVKGRAMQLENNLQGTFNIVYIQKLMERIADRVIVLPWIENGFPVEVFQLPRKIAGQTWKAAVASAGKHACLLYIGQTLDADEVFRRARVWVGFCPRANTHGCPVIFVAGRPRIDYSVDREMRG